MNTTPANIEYLFTKPAEVAEFGRPLNVAIAMGALASRMVREERSRTDHPDGRKENVAEHSYMLAKVATALADEIYPWLDKGKVALYAISHDDVEGYVGDTPTDSIANHDPELKELREALGLQQLTAEYQDLVPGYVAEVNTYEQQEEYEAQFVRIIDKFMVLLIHIPNDGAVLKANYNYDTLIRDARAVERKLLAQYPHFIEIIEMRTQLSDYLAEKYLK